MNRITLKRGAESSRDVIAPRCVSILSGKGGVGKSVVSFNLAHRMAALGWPVLLVDCDLHWGNIHILANAACRHGVSDYLEAGLPLSDAAANIADNLDILPAAASGSDSNVLTVESAATLVHKIKAEATRYSCVIMDHSSGRNPQTTAMAKLSDVNLLLMVPELTSISDCYGLYKHLLEEAAYLDLRILINRVDSIKEGEYIQRKFSALSQQFLGRTPRCQGYLLEEDLVRQAVAGQAPLAQVGTNSIVSQSLTVIAKSLMGDRAAAVRSGTGAAKSRINVVKATADIEE